LKGKEATKQSDIYSLGIVLYELLTCEPPFDSTEPFAIWLKHLEEPLPDPRQLNTDVPVSLYHVLLKATAKDPTERYQDVMELYDALDQILKSDEIGHVANLRHLFEQTEPIHELDLNDIDKDLELDHNSKSDEIDAAFENTWFVKQKKSAVATSSDYFYPALVIVTALIGVLFFFTKSELVSFLWFAQYTFSQKLAFLEEIF